MYQFREKIKLSKEQFSEYFKHYPTKGLNILVGLPNDHLRDCLDIVASVYFEPSKMLPCGLQIKHLENVVGDLTQGAQRCKEA